MQADENHIRDCRDYFLQGIRHLKNIIINTDIAHAFPGILNICFSEISADKLMQALPDLAISAGSACLSKGVEPSYVLRALGLSAELAANSVRLSFGRFTTREEIERAVQRIVEIIK